MRRTWRNATILVFSLSILLGGIFGDRLLAITDDTRDGLRAYTELILQARDAYGVDVPYRDLVYASINGMVRTLDPHTNFLTPEALSNMRERQQSSYFGLGLLVGMRNGQLTVISPLEGSPAARLGVRAGDVISLIAGEPSEKLSLDEAVQRLKGPKGTQVTITLLRRGLEKPIELTVTRAEIPQTTVRYAYMLEPGTGYILLTDFARASGDEVATAIKKLKADGMKRLLLDLRNNGGGLLDQAIDIADQFLPKDSLVVETRGRTRDSFQQFNAAGNHPDLGIPVVVLVNNGTASASEIVSGSIQDHDVGVIVGVPTWGKGLVQSVYNLSYGAGIALTTAKYYTPSGRLIQRDYSSYLDYIYHPDGDDTKATEKLAPTGPEFATDLGRKVYGGGGITPDVFVQAEDLPAYAQFLFTRNAFFDYAAERNNRALPPSKDWQPGPEVLTDFEAWLEREKVSTKDEVDKAMADEKTREFILRQVRYEMFNGAFGLEAGHRVLAGGDIQVQTALRQFDKAAGLLAQRQEKLQGRSASAVTSKR